MISREGLLQLIAIIALGSGLTGAANVPISKRSVFDLGAMLKCFNLDYTKYLNYGCYCGPAILGQAHYDGTVPVNAVDSCCQTHDNCWSTSRRCNAYIVDYNFDQKTCACKTHRTFSRDFNKCRDDLCACDYQFATCVAAADNSTIIPGCIPV
ncbi:basic phospholipase A2 nigroxin A-like [Amphiura filiformis]|uniref:basic phospholipase A2 nigroxin A-like n=1 Tax=Amphiura filiformis TaxID=82378 RepID=UPI003B21FA99